MRLSRCDLAALTRKYRSLGELGRTQHHVTALAVRAPLRQLAEEFPGALRELSTLPPDEIHRRVECLETATATGAVEPWMEWVRAYHTVMRAALLVKRRLAGRRRIDERRAFALAREAAEETGYLCDSGFVHAVARPAGGRLNAIVFERVEAEFGAPSGSIRRALFPPRRPRRLSSSG